MQKQLQGESPSRQALSWPLSGVCCLQVGDWANVSGNLAYQGSQQGPQSMAGHPWIG